MLRPSLILVREWEQQMSSSGCCGRLEGDLLQLGDGPVFAERRAIMEAMGPLYRAVRERFGDDVEVLVFDPRNMISLYPRLIRDFWRYGVGWSEAFRALGGISIRTVIVNGRLFASGRWPEPGELIEYLETVAAEGRLRDAAA